MTWARLGNGEENTALENATAAIEARLRRIEASRNVRLALEPDAAVEARRLARLVRGSDGNPRAHNALGWLHWFRYAALPEGRDQEELALALQSFGRCFVSDSWPLPEQLVPMLAEGALRPTVEALERASAVVDAKAIAGCVELLRRIVAGLPEDDPHRAVAMTVLSVGLQMQFELSGVSADLDAAIDFGRRAVAQIPPEHPGLARFLANLGSGLRMRFNHQGAASDLGDLNEAIGIFRRAVAVLPTGDGERPMMLSNLGIALRSRFERTGETTDLREAVALARDAVDGTSSSHPQYARILANLGTALAALAGLTGNSDDLHMAISAHREALEALAADDPARPGMAANLAAVVWIRFEHGRARADLDECVDLLRAALAGAPAPPDEQARLLSNLSAALLGRFDFGGAGADLDAAIDAAQQAIAVLSPGHVHRPRYLATLCGVLRTRYERTECAKDLERAVEAGREAVNATAPGAPERARYLANLGNALRSHFRAAGAAADLDAAVAALRESAATTAPDHPDQPVILSDLGNALQALHQRTESAQDLAEAIDVLRQAAAVTPAYHPFRAGILANLGNALRTRYKDTALEADRLPALEAFAAAVDVASAAPSLRARAACAAAVLTADHDTGRAAGLLQTAVRLLPEVTPRELSRDDQQDHLGGFAGLAGNAAALALNDVRDAESDSERAVRALGLLEIGRGVLLSQSLDTRNDVSDLRRARPDLATRYLRLRDLLDRAPDVGIPLPGPAPAEPSAGAETVVERLSRAARLERAAGDRQRYAAEFAATVAEIRSVPGFSEFMLPPTPEQLVSLSEAGDIVVFNVSPYRSDALLITRAGVTCLRLPDLDIDVLQARIEAFHGALALLDDPAQDRTDAENALTDVLEWLWDVAAGPVLHALGLHNAPEAGAAWPRVWWVPGGLLSLLPLHAAGHHGSTAPGEAPRTVMDRVVSSYTPTVRTLRYARRPDPTRGAAARSLIVAMPTTPGDVHGLPLVAEESERLRRTLPAATVLMEPPLPEGVDPAAVAGTPTKREVLAKLPKCAIAHFACHGTTDPTDPSRSGLLLHDHVTDRFTVAALASVRLDTARLAYLSACSTAVSESADLIDEAIHLTSAFQLAGFRNVIGTLWEIEDAVALAVADAFYTTLRTHSLTFDTDRAAETLHHICRQLRDHALETPSLWAAHLHAGA